MPRGRDENIEKTHQFVSVFRVTVNTGMLCSFKVSELDWFGKVTEEAREGTVLEHLTCVCFSVARCIKGLTL